MHLLGLMQDISALQIHQKPPLVHAEPIPGPHPTSFANACDYYNNTSMRAYTHTAARSLGRSSIPPLNMCINSCLSFPKAKSPFVHQTSIWHYQFPQTRTELFKVSHKHRLIYSHPSLHDSNLYLYIFELFRNGCFYFITSLLVSVIRLCV
jgi:hypothetical protein